MDYKVEIESGGRGGNVFYVEGWQRLPLWWEYISNGVAIDAPSSEEWDTYCDEYSAECAKGRRTEILERVAIEAQRQQVPSATFIINDQGIEIEF
jgi:hypothetical protein